ncbi:helix-turn-helix domain-containing protein [Bacteroides eggerthii]|uniref:helix-turn-helix domain-containing protein n=1 Tax=Bacteroides eggerthii TaxID=28111 RepID=UPI0018A0198D|nr:helix-turn-helix transcriptional regulator [Bacteroides eggerthii]
MNKELNCIKVVLVQKKKTGKWLAEQLGLSESTVSLWYSNATQPNLSTLSRVAKLLEVEMKDLLNE